MRGPLGRPRNGNENQTSQHKALAGEILHADPVGAATALVECFRSFTSSGYFMEDLHGAQLTLAGNDIYAIDAPETLPNAPVAAVLDWTAREGGASWGGRKYVEMRLSVHPNASMRGALQHNHLFQRSA